MSLNRDEKDFLHQVAAAIVQSNSKYTVTIQTEMKNAIQEFKHREDEREKEFKRIIGELKGELAEMKALYHRTHQEIIKLGTQTIFDRVRNLWRRNPAQDFGYTLKAMKVPIAGEVNAHV